LGGIVRTWEIQAERGGKGKSKEFEGRDVRKKSMGRKAGTGTGVKKKRGPWKKKKKVGKEDKMRTTLGKEKLLAVVAHRKQKKKGFVGEKPKKKKKKRGRSEFGKPLKPKSEQKSRFVTT